MRADFEVNYKILLDVKKSDIDKSKEKVGE